MIKSSNKRQGYSLIEFAISLAALLPIIFGTIDLNNTLRAYNALAKGSEVALRCIYPTDGACMEAANLAPRRLFNWFESAQSHDYFVRDMQYRGFGEWLNSPRFVFDTYRARILNTVSFEIPQYSVSTLVPTHQVTHPVTVWVRNAGLPMVVPNDLVNPLGRDVHFEYFAEPGVSFPQATHAESGPRVVSSTNASIRYTVTLNNPLNTPSSGGTSARAVFKAASAYDTNNSISNPSLAYLSNLEVDPFGTNNRIPAIVYIKGTLANQPANTTSKLTLSIRGNDQGGQVLSGNGQVNFYPRGVGGAMPGDSSRRLFIPHGNSTFGTSAEWSYAVSLRPGNNTIEIARTNVDSAGNPVFGWGANQTWTLTDVEVYIPRFRLTSFATECTQTSCEPSSCATFNDVPVRELSAAGNYPVAIHSGSVSSQVIGNEPRELGTYFATSQVNVGSSCNSSQLTAVETTPLRVTSQPCAANFGATSDSQRLSACAPTNEALSIPGVRARAISWSEREITVPENPAQRAQGGWDYTFEKADCNTQFTFSAPASLAAYRNFTTPTEADFNPTRTLYRPIGLGDRRPSEVKASDPAYSCQAITLETMQFDGSTTPRIPANLPATSLFAGLHPERVDGGNCSLSLRSDAVENGLPSQAWFTTTSTPVREVRVANRPTDNCVVFRAETVQTSAPQQIASQLPEGVVPQQCGAGSTSRNCNRVFAGLDTTGSQETVTGPDVAMARTLAFEAVAASYPHARRNCSESECLNTTIETDDQLSPKHVSVRNSMSVPLNLLGGNPITISSRQSRELETSFVK